MVRKTNVWLLQVTNWQDCTREDVDIRKENLKREIESLLKAAQNNAIRTNYIKAKIDNMQV